MVPIRRYRFCITTESAETVYDALEERLESLDRDRVGIVDASGSEGRDVLDATIESVGAPSDHTGISIGTAKISSDPSSAASRTSDTG